MRFHPGAGHGQGQAPAPGLEGTRRGYREGLGGATVELLSYLISLSFWKSYCWGKALIDT